MSKATLEEAVKSGSGAVANQIDVFTANRCKHPVVRMDSAADRRNFDSLRAPLVRADEAEQRL
jgi:hypothetical protein